MIILRSLLVTLLVVHVAGQNPGGASPQPGAGRTPPAPLDENAIRTNVAPIQATTAQARNSLPEGLATSDECRDDVQTLCGDKKSLTDIEVLSCMTDRFKTDEDLSDECHRHIWQFKLNVTKDAKFFRVAKEVCRQPLEKHVDCKSHEENSGKLIPCLLEHKNEITYRPCYHFLVKMGSIIFSDYRLICDFVEECEKDIKRYNCGQLTDKTDEEKQEASKTHSQGAVLQCLEDQIAEENEVDEKCARQIIRLMELSSDDFHLDRNLYFTCKDDREKFCDEVGAGEGRVYKCLFQHKFDHEMSPECRNALTTRQRLVARNYKASYELQQYCTKDIESHQCFSHLEYRLGGANDHDDIIGVSAMMLCLENAKHMDNPIPISPQCESQLGAFRQMVSDDYQMSPEIIHDCKNEIDTHCNGVEKDGGTIHCLMGLAQENVKNPNAEVPYLGEKCAKALIHLLKVDEAASGYRMDRVLAEACNPVVQTVCSSHQPGDPLVLSCLMEHLHSSDMTDDCQKRLLELQYFISRDFFLDDTFFNKCHRDAKQLCDEDIKKIDENEVTMPFSLVISCLYRHIPNVPQSGKMKTLAVTSPVCAEEVRRAMKTRALEFSLNPELEEACIYFLGKFCSPGDIQKGCELVCLQDHFENITAEEYGGDEKATACIEKLEEITEIEEAEAGNLDDILLRACEPDVDRLCSEERDSEEEGDVMRCLIGNKHDLKQDCEAGVTHFQLIELKDVKFSYNFMKACKEDINNECGHVMPENKKQPTNKNDIIECLSESHLRSILERKPSPLTDVCAAELTIENFQRHDDNMKLNPQLKKLCMSDYKKFCKTGKVKGLECLRLHHDKITPKCRKELFKMEKEEAIDPHLDTNLMRSCKSAIKRLCDVSADAESILDCLVHHKDKLNRKCFDIVREREREEFSDIRLNPELDHACRDDIERSCREVLQAVKDTEIKGEDLHGEVIECLRSIEMDENAKYPLSKSCSRHIKFITKEEVVDFRLDPMLTLHCLEPIQTLCPPNSVRNVIECLKMQYFQGKLYDGGSQECMVQVARLLKEGRSNIMTDPVMYDACQLDIQHHCARIFEGHGRIVNCLLDVFGNGEPITQRCTDNIKTRKEMWDNVRKAGLDTLGDEGQLVFNSPHDIFFPILIILMLILTFKIGVLSGYCYVRSKFMAHSYKPVKTSDGDPQYDQI